MNGAELLHVAATLVPEYLDDLQQIVNFDSGTHDVDDVNAMGEELASLFELHGCQIEWHVPSNRRIGNCYIARLAGDRPGTVALLGHHDTVYPAGTTEERPFRIDDGRAYGPGVMDMKGGVLLGIYAMRLIRSVFGDDHPDLMFIGNADEEIGSPTSRTIIESICRDVDLALVLEPGREAGSIQTTRKGVGMYELVVEGKPAHAGSRPEDGRSAILEMAYKTIALHDLTDFVTGTTINVGVVNGGTRRNVVASRAEALIDLRVATMREAERAHCRVVEIAQSSTVDGTRSQLTGGMNRPPMEKSAGTDAALAVGRQLIDEMGLEFLETTSGGGSDGNFTAALGIPTLDGLGPVGRNAHSPDEWLDVTTVAQRLALVAGLIDRCPRRER